MSNASVTHRPLPRAAIAVLATLAMLATLLVGAAPAAYAANTFTLTPSNPSSDTTPLFQWTSDSGSTSFECRVDSADDLDFVPCDPTDPGHEVTPELTEAPDPHTFDVRGDDGTGGWLAPDTYAWTVDLTPPATNFTSGPSSPTNNPVTTFEWTTSEVATSDCQQVNPSGGTTIWYSCESGIVRGHADDGSGDGDWLWLVRSTDAAGNLEDPPASYAWTLDTVAPVTTISGSPADGDVTSSSAVSFGFTTEAGATTTCGLSGAATGVHTPTTTCTSLETATTADDVYTMTVSSTDEAGNVETAQTVTWTYDTTPPETTIDTKPAALTTDPDAEFTFSSNEDPDVTYACTLNGAGAACTSPKSYPGLADGDYTFTVTATDAAGNVDATADTWDWTVDATAPTTTIDDAPSGTVTTDAATIEFSSEIDATFMCLLDDDAAGFAACTSPQDLTGLDDGPHTFSIKASDVAGNTEDPPVTASWTVDTTSPVTTITAKPDAVTNDTEARFTFSSPDTSATFTCALDSAAFGPCPLEPAGQNVRTANACLIPCESSGSAYYDLSALPDGEHTFEVRALDSAGNLEDPAVAYTWTVDTTAPVTFITSKPEGLQNVRTASIGFTSDDDSSTFTCLLDGVAWTQPGTDACVSPAELADLADGSHTFSVQATDAAGNVDTTPETATWTVDATEPSTLITDGPANSSVTTTSAASFTFTGAEGAVSFECKLDSGAWAACTSPVSLTLADGTHTFSVRSVDAAGNRDTTPDARTWTVDTVGPTLSIDTGPTGFVTSPDATFAWSATEALSGDECRLDGGVDGAWTACSPSPKSYTGLADGTHLFEVRAKDANGNTGPTTSQSWTVDRVPPNTILTSRPENSSLTTARLTFTATETVQRFECSLDSAAFSTCTSPRNLSGLSVGTHTFRVRAVDLAGQTDATPAVTSWRVEDPDGSEQFSDVEKGDLFAKDIGQLAASGVTKGCNAEGTRFCPDANVTRGQMAAFFKRALGLPAGSKVFDDTRGHVFQADIAALDRAGITKGCNDARTKFCPDDFVTRGQMAAFFTRALSLPAGTKTFSDTSGHQFQADIAALERAGITKGCNDARTKFCPDDFVTRGQMAAFFVRSGVLDG